MKSWVIVLVAICLGVGIGVGNTIVERLSHEELFLPAEYAAHAKRVEATKKNVKVSKTQPKIELVNGAVYEFGSMERLSKQSHTFLIKNVGDAPLKLKVKRTTCKCTISAINGESFMPGETGEITVEWTGKTATRDPDFKQGVEITTNDPEMEALSLIISGYVTEAIRSYPSEVVIARVSSNDGADSEFRLYGFLSETLEILGAEFEEADTADRFAIEFEPLPDDEVKKEKGAKCGVLGKLKIKSGLPLGPINQTIRVQTRVDEDITIHMPIRGSVTSDILIASAPKFEPSRSLVNFGPLKRNEAAKIALQVFVKGDYRHDTKFSVGEVDPPEYLKVDIGPPKELNNGKTIRHTVTIEIPAGLNRINRLGAEYAKHGRVVLETTHPATKQVPIRVRFAVD